VSGLVEALEEIHAVLSEPLTEPRSQRRQRFDEQFGPATAVALICAEIALGVVDDGDNLDGTLDPGPTTIVGAPSSPALDELADYLANAAAAVAKANMQALVAHGEPFGSKARWLFVLTME
jgi:hypothetical protein